MHGHVRMHRHAHALLTTCISEISEKNISAQNGQLFSEGALPWQKWEMM